MSDFASSAHLRIWEKCCLFIESKPIPTAAYKPVFDKLVVSLKEPFTFMTDSSVQISTYSYLVKAGTNLALQNIQSDHTAKAIFYLSPLSSYFRATANLMTCVANGFYIEHVNQLSMMNTLSAIQSSPDDPKLIRDAICEQFFPGADQIKADHLDSRILEVINLIERSSNENICIVSFAEKVHLSASRLEKLFKEQVGIPITTYRLRYRIYLGVLHLALGATITDAAYASGFSNLAHFSRSFSAIHGIHPSFIFNRSFRLQAYISEPMLEAINEHCDVYNLSTKASSKRRANNNTSSVVLFNSINKVVGG